MLDISINEVSERVTWLAAEVLLVLIGVIDSLPISVGVMVSKFNAKSASIIGERTSSITGFCNHCGEESGCHGGHCGCCGGYCGRTI